MSCAYKAINPSQKVRRENSKTVANNKRVIEEQSKDPGLKATTPGIAVKRKGKEGLPGSKLNADLSTVLRNAKEEMYLYKSNIITDRERARVCVCASRKSECRQSRSESETTT